MSRKHIISVVFSALFVFSACGEDDSTSKKQENPPSTSDLCKDKSVGDKCAEGKTCQAEGDKLVCKPSDTPQDDLCKDKSAGDECAEGKTCQKDGDKLVCKPSDTSQDDLCKDKTAGDECAEGKTCQKDGDKLVCKAADTSQDDLCKDKTAGDECAEGKTCQKDGDKLVCKSGGNLDDEKEWACGTEVCRGSQYCDLEAKKCIDRGEKAVAGKPCDKSTFVENCDGSKVVYCWEGKTVVNDCNETIDKDTQQVSICAMKRNENFAACVFDNNRCNAEVVGRTRLCVESNPGTPDYRSYWEYFDCERATDGKYYMFKTGETEDCVAGCIDDALCASTDDPCDSATYKSHCDGGLLMECGEDGKVFITDCMGDFNVACIEDAESGAMCDYENMPLK